MAPRVVVAESHIPYLEPLGRVEGVELRRLHPDDITPAAVADADALIVRTRTRCDASLLEGSKVKLVGTATIGTDHIDAAWCRAHGIDTVSAPGCNAPAVAQYVFASIAALIGSADPKSLTIGVVGVGHVGSIVERWTRGLGMTVLPCDPPRQRAEGGKKWVSLAEIAERADIITFHTPLTREGKDATYHLADDSFFESLRRKPIVINAARGAVADTEAWLRAIDAGLCGRAVVDCWEGEPAIDLRLLEAAAIATPHIAGYSDAGKMRASQAMADAVCSQFGLPHVDLCPAGVPAVPETITLAQAAASYDPTTDTAALRAAPTAFEALRNHYALRPEI